jgi:hypothetical protein
MGRAALDGEFATFRSKVLAAPFEYVGDTVRWTTIRGAALDLVWDGPFMVDGEPQSSADWPHLESPYAVAPLPCTSIDIRHGDGLLRLDFTTS